MNGGGGLFGRRGLTYDASMMKNVFRTLSVFLVLTLAVSLLLTSRPAEARKHRRHRAVPVAQAWRPVRPRALLLVMCCPDVPRMGMQGMVMNRPLMCRLAMCRMAMRRAGMPRRAARARRAALPWRPCRRRPRKP